MHLEEPRKASKRRGGTGNQSKNRDHTDNNIARILRPDRIIINKKKKKKKKKKRICKIVDFAVPADQRIKLKECEKKDKYLGLARELTKNYGTCR